MDDSNALIIKEELKILLPSSSNEEIDSVLVDYLGGILLEEEDNWDIIIDTLIAYLPTLETLKRDELLKWALRLQSRLKTPIKVSEPSAGTSIDFTLKVDKSLTVAKKEGLNLDPELKEAIVNSHAFVGEAASGTYRPTLAPKPTEEESKIRYYNGQIANTKGQKFVEVKKEESEEMKKTYINLKPAKKYRFHK